MLPYAALPACENRHPSSSSYNTDSASSTVQQIFSFSIYFIEMRNWHPDDQSDSFHVLDTKLYVIYSANGWTFTDLDAHKLYVNIH